MNFIRKSITAKAFIALLAASSLIGAAVFFAGDFLKEKSGIYFDFVLIAAVFLTAILIILISIQIPLAKIFREMKALVTGHPYKKIFTRRIDEVGVLAHFFNDVTKNLEKIAVDVDEGKRMLKELEVASQIQRKILPKELPQIEGLNIYGKTRPASEAGGDSFDVIEFNKNAFVYVGDVTGHGLPAAIIMIMVNTLIRTFCEIFKSGYDILANANRILKQRIEPRRFMTCVLLRWDTAEKKLYYTGAGHEHILIFRKKTGVCEIKQTGGIALGMVSDISKIIKEEHIPMEAGDAIVLYSDGITEAKNLEGEMFGLQRLNKSVEQYAGQSTPEDLFIRISKDFASFVGEQTQEDDITLIALRTC